jgi:acetyltransferase
MEAAREHHPDADVEGVLIQEMVGEDAVEVIVGVLRDADFGPVVAFGSGSVLVELFEDSSLRLPPLSRSQAHEMIEETQAARLLEGSAASPGRMWRHWSTRSCAFRGQRSTWAIKLRHSTSIR